MALRLSLMMWLAGVPALAQELTCPIPLLQTDWDRQTIAGTPALLANHVQQGLPVRVGWSLDFDADGQAELSHWADASFLTVIDGAVFTQIAMIHTQKPYPGQGRVALTETPETWHGLLGSDGTLQGLSSQKQPFPADIPVRTLWCDARPQLAGWSLAYRHDTQGKPLDGSKEALFAAIRAGRPVKIGWGAAINREGQSLSVEHLADPVFLTIMSQDHVVAQLPEHIAQRSYWNADNPFFEEGAVMWRGEMSTTGSFDAIWVHRGTGETMRRYPQRAALSWFVQGQPPDEVPLLAVTGGVTRDESRSDELIR